MPGRGRGQKRKGGGGDGGGRGGRGGRGGDDRMVGAGQTFAKLLVLLHPTHRLITASMGHVTNPTRPGVRNPSRAFGRAHQLLTAGVVHVKSKPPIVDSRYVDSLVSNRDPTPC